MFRRHFLIKILISYPNYTLTAYVGEKSIVLELAVTNIVNIGGITRSGRVFSPEQPPKKNTLESSKGKEEVGSWEVPSKKGVPQQEAKKFLRLIRKSDYKVVDQLNQTPSKISILSLLLSYKDHIGTLLKILNEERVTHDITVNQFEKVVASITANNFLGFSSEELPSEG